MVRDARFNRLYVRVAACNYAGQRYEDGEEMLPYPNEPCFVCNCRDGNMECMTTSCPPLECDEGTAVAEIGKCCPVCPGNAGALYPLPPFWNELKSYKSSILIVFIMFSVGQLDPDLLNSIQVRVTS